MAKANKKRMSGFAKGMILYVLLFVLVAALGLQFFYKFIETYEYTRENRVMERFVNSLNDEQIETMAAGFTGKLNRELCDADEVRVFMAEKTADAAYLKKLSECTDSKTVYVLKTDGNVIGTVELTLGENVFHGLLSNWQPTAGELDFSAYVQEMELDVPADYTVEINGTVLGQKYVTDDSVEYGLLEEFYENYDLPRMVKYHADGFVGDGNITVRDGTGNTVDASQLVEEYYTDNCSDAEKAALDEFLDAYIKAYMTYTSGANHLNWINYKSVTAMVVPDSELKFRIEQAIGGLGFASSHGDELKSITVNRYMNIGEGRYLCDVTYEVATIGQDGLHEYPNNTKILIVTAADGGFLAEAMASY